MATRRLYKPGTTAWVQNVVSLFLTQKLASLQHVNMGENVTVLSQDTSLGENINVDSRGDLY